MLSQPPQTTSTPTDLSLPKTQSVLLPGLCSGVPFCQEQSPENLHLSRFPGDADVAGLGTTHCKLLIHSIIKICMSSEYFLCLCIGPYFIVLILPSFTTSKWATLFHINYKI